MHHVLAMTTWFQQVTRNPGHLFIMWIQQHGQGKPFRIRHDSRHEIHVAPLADNRTFPAATERSVVTTRYLKIALD